MNTLGKILFYLCVIRVYKNGDGFGFVWRWWNPASWILMPLVFIGSAYFEGVPFTLEYKYNIGIGLDPYFVKHPEQLEWINE